MSFDTAEDNGAFHAKFSFTYPLLCDRDRAMGLAYGAAKEPGTGGAAKRVGVVIDPEGKVMHYNPSVSASGFPQTTLEMI